MDPAHAASLPPVYQKLVRKNPANKKKNYYIGSHAKSIAGWAEDAGRELLDDLLVKATQPVCIYTHEWQPGDLVIWDNRCTMHKANSDYDINQLRVMHRVMLEGENVF